MKERKYIRWGGIYEVSIDGRLRTHKYLRMLSPRIQKGRSPHYTIMRNGQKTTIRVANLIKEAFGVDVVVDDAYAECIRQEAADHNATRESYEQKRGKKRIEKSIAKAVSEASSSIHMPPLVSECMFPNLRTNITGYATFDDPQVDPFGCGTWWVRLVFDDVSIARAA